jgi:hypothetical protein
MLHFVILKLIGNCFALAPDESLYFRIFTTTYSADIYDHPEAWVEGSDMFFKILFLPAKLYSFFPILSDLEAFRIGSVTYLVSGVGFIILAVKNLVSPQQMVIRPLRKLLLLVLPFLIPTFLVWGSLGLKENLVFFCFSLIVFGAAKRIRDSTLFSSILISLGLVTLLNTKIYLAYISVIALSIFYCYLWARGGFKVRFTQSSAKSLVPFILPLFFQIAHLNQVFIPIATDQTQANQVRINVETENYLQGRTAEQIKVCEKASDGGILIRQLSDRLNGNSIESYSPVKVRSGPITEGRNIQPINEFFTVLIAFLIFPRFWDVPSSAFGQAIWLDSLFQFGVLLGGVYFLYKIRKFASAWTLFLSVNLIGLVLFYALVQVNFGTMARHRISLAPFIFAAYATYLLTPKNYPRK